MKVSLRFGRLFSGINLALYEVAGMLLKDFRIFLVVVNNRYASGFSLVELMVVIAIVGVISAFSIPSYIASMPKRRLRAATKELYGIMQQARLIAVRENLSKRIRFEADFYYFDDDNNREYDTDEKKFDLSKYYDVTFGCGGAKKNWSGNSVSHTSLITFSPTGTANSRTAYLQNIASPSECFAVTSQTSGALKVRWFDGKQWK